MTQNSNLEIKNLTFEVTESAGYNTEILTDISLEVDAGSFVAIVGPSGCGKTTLLKVVSGLLTHTSGEIHWNNRNLEEDDFEAYEIAYVPQFSIAYENLLVRECVEYSLRLQTNISSVSDTIDDILKNCGLDELADRKVSVLSGGQKRRLGLAMELVANPVLLFCDEVTSGLDTNSENEIVELLHKISQAKDGKIVLSVTHSLEHIDLYTSIVVLYDGYLVYHSSPEHIEHYFGVDNVSQVYPLLETREALEWHNSWKKHQIEYRKLSKDSPTCAPSCEGFDYQLNTLPSFFSQVITLSKRRWALFFRDKTQLLLQVALLILFPLLVVMFVPSGIPNTERLPEQIDQNLFEEAKLKMRFFEHQLSVGKLVSGVVMFQVVLLTLIGANNSAREIAQERHIFEKEKFTGVRASSYLFSKLLFFTVLVLIQGLWMGVFVDFFADLPGDVIKRYINLLLVCGAMTSICLGISSVMKSADQANLLSVYLVGFQLPLSGAILALPQFAEQFLQPLVSSFWAWAGNLSLMKNDKVYDAVKIVSETKIEAVNETTCVLMLVAHILLGVFVCIFGLRKSLVD